MAKKVAIPALGAEFGGGFFAGEIVVDSTRYALIVAPKAGGENMRLEYKKKKLGTADGTNIDDDGFYNSCLMDDDNHPAAHFCRSLRIAGHDDWYLPSRDELMRIWMALGPNRIKTPDLFKSGAAEAFEDRWYWSSTEYAPYSFYAWLVNFYYGTQSYGNKYNFNGVRAVRRLKI
jgi:hypothetical protein